jgi:hypothetical protein
MAGESGAGTEMEVTKIVLRLETNFQKVLKQQVANFDQFTRQANQLTRQVGTNMTQLARTTSKTFNAVYKSNRKEIQEFVSFTRNALQGVRKETLQMQVWQDRISQKTIENYKKMQSEIEKVQRKSALVSKSKGFTESQKKSALKVFDEQAQVIEAKYTQTIDRMKSLTASLMSKHMAGAVKESMATIEKGSRSAAVTVKNVVHDMQSRFNQLYSQRKFMGQADFASAGTQFLKDREQQIKVLESLLTAHQKKQVQAEQYLQKQKQLLSLQTNETLRKNQEKMVADARAVVRKLGGEYEYMFNQIQKFSRGQTAITGVFKTQVEQGIKAIKQTLRGLNLKRDFENLWKNSVQVAKLSGEKSGEAFYEAAKKGKALDTALVNKLKNLQGLLTTAKQLKATGLVPNVERTIASLKRSIDSIKEFRKEFALTKKELSNIPKVSFQQFAKGGVNQARSLAIEVRKAIGVLRALGPVSEDNFLAVQKQLKKIEGLYKQHSTKVVATQNTLSRIVKEIHRARAAVTNATNERVIDSWKAYERQLVSIARRIEEKLKASTLPADPYEQYRKDTIATLHRVREEVAKSLFPRDKIKSDSDFIQAEFEKIATRLEQISKKRFIRPKNMTEAKDFIEKVKIKVKEYNQQIVLLGKQLDRLRRVQKSAFGGTGVEDQISQTKAQLTQLKQAVREYERAQVQMQRKMAASHKQSIKTMLRSGWEMIRNFRWQVAAVIYLITRAVRAVQRVFLDVMGEIAKYRREAMTLAAQFTFKMLGDMRENFEGVYQYSRQLMNKMEQVAAKTILTMEDMTMLVRTFAQAGMIPDTDKDVEKIAIIGTAIKTLTEGMANAGTQMRQELYAIIAGRQRATDQLAMMFQMMGVNIQKIIEEERAGGKDLIDSLSEALAPFGVLNEKLAMEWEAILNKMKLAWQVIKRIGLEDALLRTTKELNEIADKYYSTMSGATEKGRELAALLRAAFEIIKAPVKLIGEIIKVVINNLKLVGKLFGNIYGDFATTTNKMEGLSTAMKGVLTITEVVLKAFVILRAVVRTIGKIMGIVYKVLVAIHGVIMLIVKEVIKSLGVFGELFDTLSFGAASHSLEKIKGLLSNLVPDDLKKDFEEVNDIIKEMQKNLQNLNKFPVDIQKALSLKYDPMQVADKAAELRNKLDDIELAGLGVVERANRELEMRKEEVEWLRTAATSNLAAIRAYYSEMTRMGVKFTEDDKKRMNERIKGHLNALKFANDYEKFAIRDRNKIVAEYYEKQRKQMSTWKEEYKDFWNNLIPKDLTRAEKTKKWFEDMEAALEDLRVKNPLVAKEFEKFSDRLNEALGQRKLDDIKAINQEIEKMQLKLTSHRPVDSISKINTEFDKMKIAIRDNIDWTDKQKESMDKLLESTRKERIEIEKMGMAYKAAAAEMEVQSQRAQYLAGSYSPAKRAEGEIKQLKNEYGKQLLAIQKEIDKTYKQWVENGQWATREGSAEAQRYVLALQQQMEELSKTTERELKKKQFPIWNDLVEASNQWADGFTDALSQIVDGVDSVSEALDALQKQILKDTLKIVIKRGITDQLQSALGSGSDSPMSKFFGMLPGGKAKEGGAQEVTATKPLPVMIYNPQDMMEDTKDIIGKFNTSGGSPIPVYVTNLGSGQMGVGGIGTAGTIYQAAGEVAENGAEVVQGVSQDLADISAEIAENTEAASQSTKSWYSGIQETFSSIGSWFSSLFSSGGGGGGGSSAGSLAMTAVSAYGRAYGGGGYGFADGGVISEPIVGKGMRSGEIYNFGENTKYGENEIVAPMKKMKRSIPQNKVTYNMPIHLSAIDTQSGVQFLMNNSDVIQGQFVKSLKQNKPIRKGIQNAY